MDEMTEMLDQEEELCRKAIDKWGIGWQVELIIEEAAELIVALSQQIRGRDQALLKIIEEAADVEIMLKQLRLMIKQEGDLHPIDVMKAKKLNRLKERINE